MHRASLATLAMVSACACMQVVAAPLPLVWRQDIPGSFEDSRHGSAVAMDGELMAIGAPDTDVTIPQGTFARAGIVEIHRWDGTQWEFQIELRLSDFNEGLEADSRFGAAVAVSGNRVVIGCPGCDFGTTHAFLVEFSETQAEPVMWYPLAAEFGFTDGGSDPILGAGSAVALAGTVFAVGAPTAKIFGDPEPGGVAIGRLQSGGVVWEEGFWGPDDPDGSRFGQAVALTETVGESVFDLSYTLVVGAPAYVNSGAFSLSGRGYVYKRSSGGTWSLTQQLANPDPGFVDALGAAVAIERKNENLVGAIMLGAPGRSLAGVPGGSVRIYNTNSAGSYAFEREIQHPDAEAGDGFGGALALDGYRLLVGAAGRAVDLFDNAGSVYVLAATQTPEDTLDWSQRQVLLPRGQGNAAFGSSVAVGARAAAVGAPRAHAASDDVGNVATYLCDHIFSDGLENRHFPACAGP